MRNRFFGCAGLAGAVAITAGLGGCAMPNSSNPTLSLTRAQVSGSQATLAVKIENPSEHNVSIESVDWTLVYGPLPVADGTWIINHELMSGESYEMTKVVRFTGPALDPAAREIELAGEIRLAEEGAGNMGFESASYSATANVTGGR